MDVFAGMGVLLAVPAGVDVFTTVCVYAAVGLGSWVEVLVGVGVGPPVQVYTRTSSRYQPASEASPVVPMRQRKRTD